MADWKLKRKVIPEGGLLDEEEAKMIASSKRVVHIQTVRGASEGDFLEIWYLGKEESG